MKSMLTLMKIKQREMDLITQQVTKLEVKRAEIESTIAKLMQQLREEMESATAMPDMAHFFGDYSSHIKKRQDQLRNLLAKTEEEISKLQLAIRVIYGEMKTYEQAYKQWKARETKKRDRREQSDLDEAAMVRYIRKAESHA